MVLAEDSLKLHTVLDELIDLINQLSITVPHTLRGRKDEDENQGINSSNFYDFPC